MAPISEHAETSEVDKDRAAVHRVGGNGAGARGTGEEPLVDMRQVTAMYGRVVALREADFSVAPGEVVGLLGNSGAGKSTLVKSLVGLHPMMAGEVRVAGCSGGFSSPEQARAFGIEVVYQDLALIEHLSVARNFFLGAELLRRFGVFRTLDHKRMVRITEEAFDELGISGMPSPRQMVSRLSGGQRQLLAVARAVHFARRLLILDEPTAALSDDQVEQVLEQISHARARGVAVVFVTHKAHEVFNVADRFVVLDRGRTLVSASQGKTSLNELEKLLISTRFTIVQEMAAAVAHQLRNPLGIIRVSAEMLREEFEVAGGREGYDRLLDMIMDEVVTVEFLITNYLDFARRHELRRAEVPVPELIEDVKAQLPRESFDPARLRIELPLEPSAVFVDRELMEQVLVNLLVNAAEASEEDQPVVLRVDEQAESGRSKTVEIAVRDFGCGIDEHTRKMIFNPFFTTKSRGTGLGLSIVHRIVEQHGGSLEVESEPGHGTTFTISLPEGER